MGNKPNRLKKLKNKALRKFSQIDVKKDKYKNTTFQRIYDIKPFNAQNAKEMLKDFKKQVEHVHLKNKPHHHKRTTPGSMDAENPYTKTGHENMNKTMKTWQKGSTQKSSDLSKKYFKTTWKKAA
ncbi:MAG: hypothetical protein S4CHLAM20_10290 [Chlamydiia bacterium]|nr:hypothetical protein [Chlamydiia bacterium]